MLLDGLSYSYSNLTRTAGEFLRRGVARCRLVAGQLRGYGEGVGQECFAGRWAHAKPRSREGGGHKGPFF